MAPEAIEWIDNKLRILDQSQLPQEQNFVELTNYREVASAIKEMRVRGAPAIGIAAAYGVALGAQAIKELNRDTFLAQLNHVLQVFSATRPTAINLFQTINRMKGVASKDNNVPEIKKALANEANRIHNEEMEATKRLSYLGAELVEDDITILTHCNAGPLATAGYGTALGIVKAAKPFGNC